jgi:dCMP deaminase
MEKWNNRFIDLAHHISAWSKDPRTKVGAVVVNDLRQVVGLGYNGFPRGVEDTEERYNDRVTKLLFVAHAEQNALDSCYGETKGGTLYSTLFPCCNCAKSIIQRGIKKVVTYPIDQDKTDTHHFGVSLMMFEEAGVHVEYVEDASNI